MTREMIGYAIIGLVLAIAIPVAITKLRRRRLTKLRRRGIKRYGH